MEVAIPRVANIPGAATTCVCAAAAECAAHGPGQKDAAAEVAAAGASRRPTGDA